jgi:hypothetical protein
LKFGKRFNHFTVIVSPLCQNQLFSCHTDIIGQLVFTKSGTRFPWRRSLPLVRCERLSYPAIVAKR